MRNYQERNFIYHLGKFLFFLGMLIRQFKIFYYAVHPFKKDLKQHLGPRLVKIRRDSDPDLFAITTEDNVYQEAQRKNRHLMKDAVNELLLPGSGLEGVENFIELHNLAKRGKSTLILSAHFSNLDVPTLFTLFGDHSDEMEEMFDDIIFIAGRKLTEGCKYVKALSELFNRVVISAKSSNMTEEEIRMAMKINKAAQKKINKLQEHGRIFLVYPTGTRCRPLITKTHRGLREIYNYLRKFDYFCCLGMEGNLMPTLDEKPMIHEYPRKGRLVYRFGPVQNTRDFIESIEDEIFEGMDGKQYVIDRIMNEIYALGHDPRKNFWLMLKPFRD